MAKKTVSSGGRRTLTRDRVLRTALRFADEHGIESLSMRKLGQLLGVEAMSLYNHVANKDAILDGIVDIVAGQIEVPQLGGDWRQAMRNRATSAHGVLMQHPWATMLIVSRANVGPAMLRYVDATIGCLRNAGFSYATADHAWNAIDSYVYGYTLQKLNFPFQPEEYAAVAEAYLPQLPAERYPHLHGMTRQIIDGEHDGLHELTFGLDLILEGLERLRVG
ncbi:TetR/AcrR family transcriptional regulator C-terminal domain-containing protein [Roseimaritima ulvae]|uniref:Tetracycline repressor protein class H n=1 Tax=Roseimaritima ulvae TaxID=980254 RepID=A0A5B9QVZ1_9BACT|nr:TetR/AcrR family transcriptional regulator C-terminal domain-containing protein [Roseimaritima ulvae]QEG42132.1 Tetracycline repressor protein class H [Roseimaritima ulvae]